MRSSVSSYRFRLRDRTLGLRACGTRNHWSSPRPLWPGRDVQPRVVDASFLSRRTTSDDRPASRWIGQAVDWVAGPVVRSPTERQSPGLSRARPLRASHRPPNLALHSPSAGWSLAGAMAIAHRVAEPGLAPPTAQGDGTCAAVAKHRHGPGQSAHGYVEPASRPRSARTCRRPPVNDAGDSDSVVLVATPMDPTTCVVVASPRGSPRGLGPLWTAVPQVIFAGSGIESVSFGLAIEVVH